LNAPEICSSSLSERRILTILPFPFSTLAFLFDPGLPFEKYSTRVRLLLKCESLVVVRRVVPDRHHVPLSRRRLGDMSPREYEWTRSREVVDRSVLVWKGVDKTTRPGSKWFPKQSISQLTLQPTSATSQEQGGVVFVSLNHIFPKDFISQRFSGTAG